MRRSRDRWGYSNTPHQVVENPASMRARVNPRPVELFCSLHCHTSDRSKRKTEGIDDSVHQVTQYNPHAYGHAAMLSPTWEVRKYRRRTWHFTWPTQTRVVLDLNFWLWLDSDSFPKDSDYKTFDSSCVTKNWANLTLTQNVWQICIVKRDLRLKACDNKRVNLTLTDIFRTQCWLICFREKNCEPKLCSV